MTKASSTVQATPPGSPPSPSASFYDLSDDEEGEYNTIMHSTSGRGVKLLYSKSKVRKTSEARLAMMRLITHRSTSILRRHPRITYLALLPSFNRSHLRQDDKSGQHPLLRLHLSGLLLCFLLGHLNLHSGMLSRRIARPTCPIPLRLLNRYHLFRSRQP